MAVAPNLSNISGRKYLWWSPTDFICSDCFNNFAYCFYCTNKAAQHEADKQKMALFIQFHYKREVYYERAVQVEFPVISLL